MRQVFDDDNSLVVVVTRPKNDQTQIVDFVEIRNGKECLTMIVAAKQTIKNGALRILTLSRLG